MSILNILKKIKFPCFGDDFIQDPIEKSIEGAPASDAGLTHQQFEHTTEIDNDSWDERCRVMQRHHDPSDPTSLSSLNLWEDP